MKYRFLILAGIALVCFLFGSPDIGVSESFERAPYSLTRKTVYKQNLRIEMREFSGDVDASRIYLKKLVANILKDRIQFYKSIKIDRPIPDFDRKTFQTADTEPAEKTPPTLLAIQFVNPVKDAIPAQEGQFAAAGTPVSDVIIGGTVSYRGNRLQVSVSVENRLYDTSGTVALEGSLKEVNVLVSQLTIGIMKLIINNYGFLSVTSKPAGAGLYVDNRYFGKTDVSNIVIEAGEHKIEVRTDDQYEAESVVMVPSHGAIALNLELQQLVKPGDRTIRVVTHPEKASVYLDSRLVGVSPVEIRNVRPGTYRLRVAKEGYVTRFKTLKIEELKDATLEFNLEAGKDDQYYFTRNAWYNTAFKVSLIGAVVCAVTSFYLDIRIEDERAQVRGFSYKDPNNPTTAEMNELDDLRRKADERIDTFRMYQNISIYAAVTFLVSTGVFYFLDVRQYDIDIAFYWDPGILPAAGASAGARRQASAAEPMGFRSAGLVLTYFF